MRNPLLSSGWAFELISPETKRASERIRTSDLFLAGSCKQGMLDKTLFFCYFGIINAINRDKMA